MSIVSFRTYFIFWEGQDILYSGRGKIFYILGGARYFIFWEGQDIFFLFSKTVQTGLAPYSWVTVLFPRDKSTGAWS
jgi:hypothetical protein